ncbi:MAG: hypothetical protein HOW73_22500 [Polyangiaceae bacterium]|nr:hypothetical protein [Polyangiaceae bacterium]
MWWRRDHRAFRGGYFVPLGGLKVDAESFLDPLRLRAPFHMGTSCTYGGEPRLRHPNYSELPGKRLELLIERIAEIPWWSGGGATDETTRTPFVLDEKRLSEIVEGWVPVVTPDGAGILIWPNCD